MKVRQDKAVREPLDRLHFEVEELRASRKRLVLAADAYRRRIERELHDGPQQELVAFAVNLQLARRLVDVDPAAVGTLIDDLSRDVKEAIDETRELAHRIYSPLLDAGGLGAALRSAAASVGVRIRVQVATSEASPELAGTVYFCCRAALERAGAGARATVTVHEEDGALVFEIVDDGAGSGPATADADIVGVRDRLEALDGELTIASEPGRGTHVSGSLPIPR